MGTLHQDLQNDRIYKRALKVRTMRLAKYTYKQIGDKLNISVDTVRRDLDRINIEFIPNLFIGVFGKPHRAHFQSTLINPVVL